MRERVASAFREVAVGLGIRAEATTIDDLVARYDEPHRRYHGMSHLLACIDRFEKHRDLATRPAEVLAALLFHDAVYDPHRSDNEAKSAALATQAVAGGSKDAVDRIAAMIEATAGHVASAADDTALVLDIDLAILGAPREVYNAFERAIRDEYALFDDEAFRAGRRAILDAFLARRAIYIHPPLRDELEARARENLSGASAALLGMLAR